MRRIKLTKNMYAVVDNNKFHELNQHKWCYCKGYAVRSVGGRKNLKTLYMHREILGTPEGMFTDHVDHDGLNNQLNNLRIVNKSQNMINCLIPKTNTSGYKGVYKIFITWKSKKTGKINRVQRWRATIFISGKQHQLGKFKSLEEAASARQKAEMVFWGNSISPTNAR
jgi:hypothetical protein